MEQDELLLYQRELCRTAYRNYVAQNKSQPKTRGASYIQRDYWDKHVRDLTLFKQHYGHCRVPRHCSGNAKLGRWVMNVRSQCRYLLIGKKTSLVTQERLQQLQELGFDFAPKNKSHVMFYVDRWLEHLQELQKFKAQNGHCRVPQRYSANKKLGAWVLYVRHQYRKHQRGQRSTMTSGRIEQLFQIGFDFEPRRGRPGSCDSC